MINTLLGVSIVLQIVLSVKLLFLTTSGVSVNFGGVRYGSFLHLADYGHLPASVEEKSASKIEWYKEPNKGRQI